MAGKGRGVAAFTFNIEALGIGRGSMPETRVGPNPLFPQTDFKPMPLKDGEDENYMLALKQEMRGTMQRRPQNIKPLKNKAEVERYTERYLKKTHVEDEEWTPGIYNMYKTLIEFPRKDTEAMLSKLDVRHLLKDDGTVENSDEENEKKKNNEEEEIEEEELEEDAEEDNDYNESYFDNGEDFAADSDDNMDGEATY
uniref:DNA-directed RNA polymerase III subunit n=1 Tax=Neogobius melanostomus TaxID=47308 RepID=A0A8C6V181_9GOBI